MSGGAAAEPRRKDEFLSKGTPNKVGAPHGSFRSVLDMGDLERPITLHLPCPGLQRTVSGIRPQFAPMNFLPAMKNAGDTSWDDMLVLREIEEKNRQCFQSSGRLAAK